MKTLYFIIIYLLLACSGTALAQEIPNGDGDLLWERPLNGRTVNDAKFHPKNGNIIAAVNHEIWEIDPKDGHTIRVFQGGYPGNETDEFKTINLTSDGNTIITDGGCGIKGITFWDYETGKIKNNFDNKEIYDYYGNTGIYSDNQRIAFITYQNNYGSTFNIMHINVYDINLNKIIKSLNKQDTYCDKFRMSNDGKYIAFGFRIGTPKDGWIYTMELWDTETLTKIKDFGSPGDIIEFRDVQISDDNQYVGFLCGGSREIKLFNIGNSKLIKRFENTAAFSFTPNSKIIVYSGTKPENAQSNIYTLPTLDTVYQYIWARSFFRFNESNEMYTGSKMYSSRWYFVGVNEPKEPQAAISPNPAEDYIEVNVGAIHELPLQEIQIFDIFGIEMHPPRQTSEYNVPSQKPFSKVFSSEPPQEGNKYRIDISTLPPGVYFVRIGDEKPLKFVKM